MRGSWAFAAVLVAACYQPAPSPGAPCGPEDSCPSGQECRGGYCFAVGTPADADDMARDRDAPNDATVDAMPWGTPSVIASLETSDSGETDPSISSDRLTAVLSATTTAGDTDLWLATRTQVAMPFTLTKLTALNSPADEDSAEISADGKTIYFASDRVTAGSDDIYVSTFTSSWSMPTVVASLSSTGNDGDLAVSPDGLTAVVLNTAGQNKFLFHTRASTTAPFGAPAQHAELHITADIAAPTITNDAQTIYFHAGSTRDLYVAHLQGNGTYTTPVPVTELNTTGRDAAPFVLQSDRYMIFERGGDIYEVTR
ncbi:MAG: hypothetical protein HOV81_39470 [Kofleriaceae bacterium]|nr:hypothetical protein [Kofleriaceae bacterium]